MAESEAKEQARLASELADARQDQRLYRELFENSQGLMCVHDLDGVILVVNPAAARSLGFKPEEGVGVNMKRFLAPAVQPLFAAYLDRIRRKGSDSGLMRLMAVDGTERIWLYRNILFEAPGAAPRVLGHAQDITERVRSEETLKESERRFRTLADTAPVFIWMAGTDGQCVFVNKAWLDFTGRTLDQELGRGWAENFHPDDYPRGMTDFLAAFAKREPYQSEYRMRRADGEYRWILDTGTPRFSPGGRFAGYIGSCIDITQARNDRDALRIARDELTLRVAERTAELVRANEALRESEQHYQVLTDLAPVGIFRTDAAGRCIYVNERTCQITGMSQEEAREGRWDKILDDESRARLALEWRKVLEGGGPGSLEHPIARRDGSAIWALTHFAAERDASGVVTGCIGTIADVSGRKRAEEENRKLETQMQHAQRLQSLGILAGGLAHDFNNLLTVILGNARMAMMALPKGSAALDNLAEIEAATSRAADLTNQMLAYSGKGRFTVQAVNLSHLAEEVTNLLQTLISKRTAILFDLAASLPSIEADPSQISQIAMNLITNASEAIGTEGGVIRVSTGVIEATRAYLSGPYFDDQLPPGRYVFLEVSDTGCGMSPETQSRIFDPFFTTKFTGRGLGLAAVIGIVRAHHGALKVSSELGNGSNFRVLFPVAGKPAQGRVNILPRSLARPDRGAILVVDDEAAMRDLARAILEKSGFTVMTAANGDDAIRIFRLHTAEIQAILLDLTMPVMNGEEAAAEFGRIRPDVPIVLSSGYSEQEVAGRFPGKNLAGFLKKPYEPADLVETLQKTLEERAAG